MLEDLTKLCYIRRLLLQTHIRTHALVMCIYMRRCVSMGREEGGHMKSGMLIVPGAKIYRVLILLSVLNIFLL